MGGDDGTADVVEKAMGETEEENAKFLKEAGY